MLYMPPCLRSSVAAVMENRYRGRRDLTWIFLFLTSSHSLRRAGRGVGACALSVSGKPTEEMDRRWMTGILRDGSRRWCWLDGWLLHGNVGAQLCMWGGVRVVTELAAPGGSLVTLPVTCGTHKVLVGSVPVQGGVSVGVEWVLGFCGLLPGVHSRQGWALGQVRGAAGG